MGHRGRAPLRRTLDVDVQGQLPPALGGRGNLVGSFDNTTSLVVSVYGNWAF